MIKPKVWLHKNGHIETIGRGRMSAAHIALINEAVANGEQIEGYSIVKAKESSTGATEAAPTVERTKVDPNRVVDVPDLARDERTTMAYYHVDGKRVEVGMRTVDNVCGSSLTYCHCEKPIVWVDSTRSVVVLFTTRNTNN